VKKNVTANRVLPVALKDGYTMTIVAKVAKAKSRTKTLTTAEKNFVEPLMSDFRLKIAKCATPTCGMYFQLGKWNHPYEKGTRCSGYREAQQHKNWLLIGRAGN
jgi:hypothetical protein